MSTYPGALDALTNPAGSEFQDGPSHAAQHANANDALEAVQATLGVNPQGSEDDVAARIAALEDAISGSFGAGLNVTLVGKGTSGGGTTMTITPTMEPGMSVQPGDLVIFMGANHNAIPNAAGPAQGTGVAWDQRLRFDTDGDEWIWVYTRLANATEPASYSITTNSASATISGCAIVILRGPSVFRSSAYTDSVLSTSAINGAANGVLIAIWLSALAAGTLFASPITQHIAYRVTGSQPAMCLGSIPVTNTLPWGPYTATAAGISSSWLGNLVMIWE